MINFMESKESLVEDGDKCLDPQLWLACAGGGMVQLPVENSTVFYFPQGHAEHASGNVDFRSCPKVPSYIPCRVSRVKFSADFETDEVYTRMRLVPIGMTELDTDDGGGAAAENQEKPASFAKTLTQSDANNGGGFSVPRYCAETIFPRLDYSADPPVQTIFAKDVRGETWKFRHIYRGTPRRHLLTTGWSTFVNQKKLVAGDSIVFMRSANGDLCVGIRRAKRGVGRGNDTIIGWNPVGYNAAFPYGVFPAFMHEDEAKSSGRNGDESSGGNGWIGRGKVKAEDVIEAVNYAARGQPFDVVYYPRASAPEFCVKTALVKAALRNRWFSDMRFKMAFETEDSSRISWFMGTISSAHAADPLQWPDSPWRLLQVCWDEPELLQNVKRVNPWQVELVSNMPAIHFSSFIPPPKKLRLQSVEGQIPVPAFSGNPILCTNFGCLSNNTPAGMQGARHAQFGLSLSEIHLNKMQSGLLPDASNFVGSKFIGNDNVSCALTIGNPSQGAKKTDNGKSGPLILFGTPMLPENHTSESCSTDRNSSFDRVKTVSDSDVRDPIKLDEGFHGHCKVFVESEDVGRTLDLGRLNSYEELYSKVANMFGIEASDMRNRVRYCDDGGEVRRLLADAPFSNFVRTARRLTIVADNDNNGA
ncbi:auxin response factor 18-like [Andrographis paniculata]|uniref:auxin response factor 18-like n=1 Tax=Andrographis paniculata TaxID=175694 RepID=UPI0021E88191|nr:auxin response factor 18-like [Andrographis paniculata]XP_051132199.1 auxin response factor 18-like [Andrographis paniculata]